MISHYCELKLIPSLEIPENVTMSHVMNATHRLLCDYGGRVGLAFPKWHSKSILDGAERIVGLGNTVRFLGCEDDIRSIHRELNQISEFGDYSVISEMQSIPKVEHFMCYQRKQPKGNSRWRRLKRRHEARGTWTAELEQAVTNQSSHLALPHVAMKSASTGQSFMLFMNRVSVKAPVAGEFSSYGLAVGGATVPDC